MLSFLTSKHPGVERLGYIRDAFLTFSKLTLFSNMAILFNISMSVGSYRLCVHVLLTAQGLYIHFSRIAEACRILSITLPACWLKAQHSENEDHGIWSHHFMRNRWGNSGNSVRLYFGGSKMTADGDCSHEIKRHLLLGRKVMTNLDSILKSRDITLSTKVHLVKAVFSSGHVWMWELDCEESWVPKNRCFQTVVLEKTLESPLDCKEIQRVPWCKGDRPWDLWKEWC